MPPWAGADAYSDRVELAVEAFENVAVTVGVEDPVAEPPEHFTTRQTSYASPPGSGDVLALEGIKDIGNGASAEAVIAGLAELVARARSRGLNVLLGTLTPSGGTIGLDYGTAAGNERRLAVSDWIRARSGADAVDLGALRGGDCAAPAPARR